MKPTHIVATVLLLLLAFATTAELLTPGTIFPAGGTFTVIDDTVLIDDIDAYIATTPKTIAGEGWTTTPFIFKGYTGKADVLYGFADKVTQPTAVELYDPHTVKYETTQRIFFDNVTHLDKTTEEPPTRGVAESPNTHKISYRKHDGKEASAVIACDSYTHDEKENTYTAFYHTIKTRKQDYRDISDRLKATEHKHDGKTRWWQVSEIPVTAGQQYTVRAYIRTSEGSDSKYDIAIKPSGETIPEAIAAGHFYILDPWAAVSTLTFTDPTPANESTIYVDHTTINVSIATSDLTYFAFNWNGTNKTYTTAGTQWNESTNSYTRTTTVGTYTQPDFDNIFPWSEMRRCTLWDNGSVNYYLHATDSTLKADGTASCLTGADGQVMVEIPKFHYDHAFTGSTHDFNISRFNLTGFTIHNAFIKDDVEVDYRYFSAYGGSMWDATTSAMVSSANITVDMYASGDKLCSISGEFPKTNEMRSEFRTMAAARGAGWRQLDFDLNSAVQLLYIIEYGDFDSQTEIGYGRTQLSGGTWTADSYIGQCGKSNSDGDGTNSVAGNTNNAYMTYRGIENWYGNVWKWNDGINIFDNIPYVTNNASAWADATETGYTNLSVTLAAANNYQITLADTDRGFLPASAGASSTYISDYYWQNPAWRVVSLGGSASHVEYAGAFCIYAHTAASYGSIYIGGRLAR